MIGRLKRQTKKRRSVKRQRMEMFITFADLAAGIPNFRYRIVKHRIVEPIIGARLTPDVWAP
jgi:hypothetical protein